MFKDGPTKDLLFFFFGYTFEDWVSDREPSSWSKEWTTVSLVDEEKKEGKKETNL